MLTFICLVIFGLILLIATCMWLWQLLRQAMPSMKESAQEAQDILGQINKYLEIIFGKDFLGKKLKHQEKPKKEEEPIQDAEFKDVEPEHAEDDVMQDVEQKPAKIPGSYERVELHLSSGVDYIEYFYFDDNDKPMEASKATKCLIRECAADGTVMRELWGKPYKNQIYDHMRDIFKRN